MKAHRQPTPQETEQRTPPLRFAERLAAQAATVERRKGERTRDRLKIAAASLLETIGYRDLRVSDINEAAGVSNALFYVYFRNKQEITQEVLTEFLHFLQPPKSSDAGIGAGPADAMYRANLGYARSFAANPGLMRCLIQFGDEIPAFGRLWTEFNDRWSDRTLRALQKGGAVEALSPGESYLLVASLGMMNDGLLRVVFVDRNPRAIAAADSLGGGPDALALMLTRIWYRAIFCRDMDWSPSR